MTTTKPLKAITITKALTNAGFLHSRMMMSSRVKGWGSSSEGFETENDYDFVSVPHDTRKWDSDTDSFTTVTRWKDVKEYTGTVYVTYTQYTSINIPYDPAYVALRLTQMATTLEGLGFTVTRENHAYTERLVVTR